MIPIILMMLVMGVGDDFCPGDLMICSVSCWMFACQPLQRWLRQADRFISIVASTLASYIYIYHSIWIILRYLENTCIIYICSYILYLIIHIYSLSLYHLSTRQQCQVRMEIHRLSPDRPTPSLRRLSYWPSGGGDLGSMSRPRRRWGLES